MEYKLQFDSIVWKKEVAVALGGVGINIVY